MLHNVALYDYKLTVLMTELHLPLYQQISVRN